MKVGCGTARYHPINDFSRPETAARAPAVLAVKPISGGDREKVTSEVEVIQ